MKKICIILLLNRLFVHTLVSQTLIQQIENAYNTLDSIVYIENIILSYKENLVIQQNETNSGTTLDKLEFRPTYHHLGSIERQNLIDSLMNMLFGSTTLSYREDLLEKKVWEEICAKSVRAIRSAYQNTDDSIQRCYIVDSIMRVFSKIWMERDYSTFIFAIKNKPVHFVLNLMFEKHGHPGQHAFFMPDTSKMKFDLISFDKRYKPQFYVYVVKGKFVEYHSFFPTFLRKAGKNVPKIYRKILRKKPRFMLNCANLEGGNTIWYVLNDEIYVYRIIQMKEYKLNDYIKRFM